MGVCRSTAVNVPVGISFTVNDLVLKEKQKVKWSEMLCFIKQKWRQYEPVH